MVSPHEDPAEQDSVLRFYYRGWRPTLLGRCSNRVWAWAAELGLLPDHLVALLVMERQSHKVRPHILVAVTYQGQRYLVSMLGGGSNWVQDARATGGAAFIKRGRKHPITLTEIPPGERAPILKAWCQIATSGRKHLPATFDAPISAFEAIAANYPVFRIDPRGSAEITAPGCAHPRHGPHSGDGRSDSSGTLKALQGACYVAETGRKPYFLQSAMIWCRIGTKTVGKTVLPATLPTRTGV